MPSQSRMRLITVCISLTSGVWGVLFLATRIVLFAQGTLLAQAVDAGNARLRADCADILFRERLGTHVTICDIVQAEVSTWPLARGMAYAFERTYLCGSPCAEVGATLMSNPMNVVLLIFVLMALPYLGLLLSRTPMSLGQSFDTLDRNAPLQRLERGYMDRNWEFSRGPPCEKIRWE
jgi:hypothetical protein